MSKLIILSVIAVSVSAQFVSSERRPNERGNLRINNDEPKVNQEYQEESSRANSRQRNIEHRQVGGFQNGNFAPTDGRLRTNLDSGPGANGNLQPKVDSTYVVEEGAAFRRPNNGQFDVHSSLGRNVDVSFTTMEPHNPNEERQHHFGQQNRERDHGPNNNQNVNTAQNGEQGHMRNGHNNQHTQVRSRHNIGNGDEETNSDQTRQTGRDSDNNVRNQQNFNENTFNNQDNRKRNQNEAQTNSRSNGQNINTQHDVRSNSQNEYNNQNVQQTGTGTSTNSKNPVKNEDREAMDRQINNQISKMIFVESTLEVTTKSNTKTTRDNELPSRSSSGKQDDRWIWSDDKNVTTPANPEVDDRASFVGDQCPTGQVMINKICVDVDT